MVVSELPDGVELRVLVVPNASRNEIVGLHGEALKVRVSASPEGGKANKAVCKLVAQWLCLKPGQVSVIGGASSRQKILHLVSVKAADVNVALKALKS